MTKMIAKYWIESSTLLTGQHHHGDLESAIGTARSLCSEADYRFRVWSQPGNTLVAQCTRYLNAKGEPIVSIWRKQP